MRKRLVDIAVEAGLNRAERDLRKEIARALATNNPKEEEWAIKKLRGLGDGGANIVAELVREEPRYHRRMRLGLWIGLVAMTLSLGGFLAFRGRDWTYLVLTLGYITIIALNLLFPVRLRRRALADILVEKADTGTAGLMLQISDRTGLPHNFVSTLAKTMRALDADQVTALSKRELLAVRKLIGSPDADLALSSLDILAQVGTEDDLTAVTQLTGLGPDRCSRRVREAALQTAGHMRSRFERERAAQKLLRPVEADSGRLLRPATGSTADSANLLHITESADAP